MILNRTYLYLLPVSATLVQNVPFRLDKVNVPIKRLKGLHVPTDGELNDPSTSVFTYLEIAMWILVLFDHNGKAIEIPLSEFIQDNASITACKHYWRELDIDVNLPASYVYTTVSTSIPNNYAIPLMFLYE